MFKEIIISYLIGMWAGIVLWCALLLVIFLLCRKSKNKEIRLGGTIVLIIAIFFMGYGAFKTALGVIDVNAEAYVVEEATCSKYYKKNSFLEHPFYITRQDGTSDQLVGASSYPEGEYSGTVTYSRRSKIILDFQEDAAS